MSEFYKKVKWCLILLIFLAVPGVKAQVNTYAFSTLSAPYAEITGGTVLGTATGTTGAASLDDIVYNLPAGTIPFNFNFNGVNYTSCYVSTNGFITFGPTAPSATGSTTGHTPLSALTAYSGAVSPLGRNLNSFFFSGNPAQTGQLRYETIGNAPNRVFVIQYKNFKTFNTSATTYGPVINMQIRLYESSMVVDMTYNCSGNIASATAQVGLRGPNNSFPTNINNRAVAAGVNTWATSNPGTANNSTCQISATLLPPSGLVYRFTPVLCPAAQNLGVSQITQTSAQLSWTSNVGGATFQLEYGPAGFTPGTGTVINNAVSPITLNNLTANTAYTFIIIQNCGVNGNSPAASFNFSTGTAGEDCSSAPLISVASDLASCSYTTLSSGLSANGPNALCSDLIGGLPNDDRWVKFVAPANGKRLNITTNAGTANDWVMEVWSACGGLTAMKCADDDVGYMPRITICQNEYVAGQTYYIRVWTYSQTATGTMDLCIYEDGQCNVPPVNDECLDAIRVPVNQPLACPGNAQIFTTQFATVNGATASCDASSKRDVYFVFNTGSFTSINIHITPQTATTLKAQLLFECGGFQVSCWNPVSGIYNFSGFNPVADYILRVWSDTMTAGTFSLCLSATCSNPTATISGARTICSGATAALNVNMSGVPPFSFTYTDGTTQTTVNTSNPNYILNVSPTSSKNYSLVSMSDASCAGAVSGLATVDVIVPQTVTLAPFTAVCSNNPPLLLTGGAPAGGIYSGINVSNGAFNPSGGSKLITYTINYAPGCSRSATQSFPVNSAPNASLASLGTVCNTTPAYSLTGGSPLGGVYSGTGVSGNFFDPGIAGPGANVIFYTYTSANGCSATAANQVIVLDCGGCDINPTASAGANLNSCAGAPVTVNGLIGGSASSLTWTNGTGSYSPSATSATISYTPSAAEIAAGVATLILVTDDPDGTGPCVPAKDTVQINIINNAVTLGSFNPVCINAGAQTLSGGSPAGGVYSGVNVSGGFFNPANGTQTITYTVTFAPGCNGSASSVFNVNPLPTVSMSPVGPLCTVDPPVTLTQGSPAGGTYFGAGVSGNIFSPSVVGAGTTTITYSYTNANGCTNSANNTAVVNVCSSCPNPATANAGADKVVCANALPVNVVGSIGGTASTSTWSGGTGTYAPNANALSISYSPSAAEIAAGFAQLILTTNDPDGAGPCLPAKDTVNINISALPALTPIAGNSIICRPSNGEVFSVNPQPGVSYIWSVPANYSIVSGQSTSSITVNIANNAVSGTIIVTGSNSCGSSQQTKPITLRTAVPGTVGSITGTNTVCQGDSFQYRVAKLSTADYYVWYPPIGGTINGSSAPFQTTDTIVWVLFNASFTGDTLQIKGGNCKGLSNAFRNYIITRRTTAPPTPGAISGPFDNLCGVTSAIYTHNVASGAKSYTWRSTVPGALFDGQPYPYTTVSNSVTVTYPASWGMTAANLYVKSNNACGSSTERTLAISTPPARPAAITGLTSVCTGATNVSYSCTTVPGTTTYQWTIPSGIVLVSGQGTNTVVLNFNNSVATRTLRVSSVNACGLSAQRTLNVSSTVCAPQSREGLDPELTLQVYPNPAKDIMNVQVNSPVSGNSTLRLYDMEGSLVRDVPVPVLAGANQITLDIAGLRSGLYLLQVENATEARQLRIMIE